MKIVTTTFILVALLLSATGFSQTKIAYIRIDDIVGLMPELAPAKVNMDTIGSKYIQDAVMPAFNEKQKLYNDKIMAYGDTSKKYTALARKALLDELNALQTELAGVDQYLQQVRQERQQQFLRPFYIKAKDAIALVAKEKGYTHVASTDIFLIAPEADDISIAVLQKLNIPVPQNKTPGSAATKSGNN